MDNTNDKTPCPRWHIEDIINENKPINKNEAIEGYNIYSHLTSFKTFGILCTYCMALSYLIGWISYTWNSEELRYVLHDKAHVKYGNMFFKCKRYVDDNYGDIPSLFNLRLLVPFPNYIMRLSVLTLIITRFFLSYGHYHGAAIKKEKIINEYKVNKNEKIKEDRIEDYSIFHTKILPIIPIIFILELLCFAMVLIVHPALDNQFIYVIFFILSILFSSIHMVLIIRSNMYKLNYSDSEKKLFTMQLIIFILYILSSPPTVIYHLSFTTEILCSPIVPWYIFILEVTMIISYFAFQMTLMHDVEDINFMFVTTPNDLYFEVHEKYQDNFFPEMYREFCEKKNIKMELKAVREYNKNVREK
uniref:Transporter n=1 Tax=Parastrongyloides trichosuri TaxID=131310 RepID=A0A0N4Z9G6_PARTI